MRIAPHRANMLARSVRSISRMKTSAKTPIWRSSSRFALRKQVSHLS